MHGDTGSIPGSGRSPGGGNGNPLQLFFPREPHGQRILVGHSAYGPKGLDKTEHTHACTNLVPEAGYNDQKKHKGEGT